MQQIESHTTEKFSKESRTHRNGNRSTDDSHFSTGASLRTWRCHGRRFAWQRRLAMSLAARHRVASPRESWSCVRRKQGRTTTLTGRKALPIDANGENCRGHVSFVVFFSVLCGLSQTREVLDGLWCPFLLSTPVSGKWSNDDFSLSLRRCVIRNDECFWSPWRIGT